MGPPHFPHVPLRHASEALGGQLLLNKVSLLEVPSTLFVCQLDMLS